jgi:hypothetical protein
MRPAFQIFDIVDCIFGSHFRIESSFRKTSPFEEASASDDETLEARGAVLWSALCCRGFLDVALKYPWWDQDRLTNLLGLVPGFFFCNRHKRREIATGTIFCVVIHVID